MIEQLKYKTVAFFRIKDNSYEIDLIHDAPKLKGLNTYDVYRGYGDDAVFITQIETSNCAKKTALIQVARVAVKNNPRPLSEDEVLKRSLDKEREKALLDAEIEREAERKKEKQAAKDAIEKEKNLAKEARRMERKAIADENRRLREEATARRIAAATLKNLGK